MMDYLCKPPMRGFLSFLTYITGAFLLFAPMIYGCLWRRKVERRLNEKPLSGKYELVQMLHRSDPAIILPSVRIVDMKLEANEEDRTAAEFAKKCNAGKLLLGHFSSRYGDEAWTLQRAAKHFPRIMLLLPYPSFSLTLITDSPSRSFTSDAITHALLSTA